MVKIRQERPDDFAAVYEVNSAAFPSDAEARLVEALRLEARPPVSLVAESDGKIVGHIFFSPVSVDSVARGSRTMGLAPMAVLPDYQMRGIGSKLVLAGLDACRECGAELVFVLGHPDYYPRFGFRKAASLGLHYKDRELDPYFFVLELAPGALRRVSGTVAYHALFEGL
jgi:putative acetyltransferase